MAFNTIEEAIEAVRNGEIIVVVDDEDRENEGDLLMAADKVTPEAVNFMATYGRGLICTPIAGERLEELAIGAMVEKNTDNHETAFTVSIDSVETTTGISAHERALAPINFYISDVSHIFHIIHYNFALHNATLLLYILLQYLSLLLMPY